MLTLREAFDKHLLRPVLLTEKGGLHPYTNEPWLDYTQYMGEKVAVVNVVSAFLFMKGLKSNVKTIKSASNISLVEIGHNKIENEDFKKAMYKSRYIQLTLTDKILDQKIVEYNQIKKTLIDPTFDELATRLINGEPMTQDEITSLMVDQRTGRVIQDEKLFLSVTNGFLFEFVKQNSPRACVYAQAIQDGISNPDSLRLFTPEQQKVLKGAKKLR